MKSFHLDCYECVLCNDRTEETLIHLFWDCDFAFNCWQSILGSRRSGLSIFYEVSLAIQSLPTPIAMEIMIMGCWNIWTQRNDKIFRQHQQSVQAWRFFFMKDLKLLRFKVKEKYFQELSDWISCNL